MEAFPPTDLLCAVGLEGEKSAFKEATGGPNDLTSVLSGNLGFASWLSLRDPGVPGVFCDFGETAD